MYGGGGVAVGRGGAGEVPEVLIVQVWFSAAVWKTSLHSLCNKLQFIYLTSQLVRSCLMKVKMKQKVNILLLWSERRPTVCWQQTVIGYWNKNKTPASTFWKCLWFFLYKCSQRPGWRERDSRATPFSCRWARWRVQPLFFFNADMKHKHTGIHVRCRLTFLHGDCLALLAHDLPCTFLLLVKFCTHEHSHYSHAHFKKMLIWILRIK